MPYPTHNEVRDIVSTMFGGGGDADPAGFDKVIDDGFQGAVVGREFALGADQVIGKQAWIDQLVHPLRDAKDLDKPSAMNVVRIIGGAEDGWNAIELLGTGTSKAGKEWHNETVVLARFTEDKQLIEAKIFLDQAHIQKHLDDADVVGPATNDTE
ncbi:MAG: hypothetical protein HETSPECPRED_009719 [Heterodermia speciosa]|uniref:SnoaL-like domain-containing protein n=1 Tax=Heterodermia speciosa TaxID=116794 RepID=A0A8H3G244_9LECA|nr:MAG: hypothetical protein HETSPECPRED_009719 [Heterodermia speciosa]